MRDCLPGAPASSLASFGPSLNQERNRLSGGSLYTDFAPCAVVGDNPAFTAALGFFGALALAKQSRRNATMLQLPTVTNQHESLGERRDELLFHGAITVRSGTPLI